MTKEIICIKCPLGCRMNVELDENDVKDVKGHQCKQGKKHAQKEVLFPGRILTTTIKTDIPEFPLLPVRSNKEIPKDQLMTCMGKISKQRITSPTEIGQPIIMNILGLGVDIISCRTVPLLR